jgi:predicted DNA-binding transcriptional regulator YafY
MLETSARLLRLLSLLQVRPDWAGAELARRLDVTPRTLRRDVQRLRGLGYPVPVGVVPPRPWTRAALRAVRGRPESMGLVVAQAV